MVRHTDMEVIVKEEEFSTHRSWKRVMQGSTRRQKEQNGATAFSVISMKIARQGRVCRFRIASMNDFSGLWSIRAISTCLVPTQSSDDRAEDIDLVCEN